MPNSNYARGAQFERKLVEYLRGRGWFAQRSAGSHGLTDVVSVDPYGQVYFIQCKTGKAKMTKAQHQELLDLADKYNAVGLEVTPETYKEML